MKTVKYFALIVASVLSFTNCTIELDKWEEIDLSTIPEVLKFSGIGKCYTDYRLPNCTIPNIEYKTNQNWCSVSSCDFVYVEMNNTGNPRTATISFTFNGKTVRTITVEQAALEYVIIGDLCIQKTDISPNVLTHSTAESFANSSRVEGFTDWRLPTIDELWMMYERREDIGGFKTTKQNDYNTYYWSSEADYDYHDDYNHWCWWYMVKGFSNGTEGWLCDADVGQDNFHVYARAVRTVKSDDAY